MGRSSRHAAKKHQRAETSQLSSKIISEREKLRASILDGFRAKLKLPGKGGALLVAQGGAVSPVASKCRKIEPKIALACKDLNQHNLFDSGMEEASKVQRRKTRAERNRGRVHSKSDRKQTRAEGDDKSYSMITENRLTHRLGLFNQGRKSSTVTREILISHDENRAPSPFSISPKSICLSSCSAMIGEEEVPFPPSPDVMDIAQDLLSGLDLDHKNSYLRDTRKALYQLLQHNAPGSMLLKSTPVGQTPASQTYSHTHLSSATVKRSLFEDKTPNELSISASIPHSAPIPNRDWRSEPGKPAPLQYMDARSMLQLNDEMLEQSFSQQDDLLNRSFNQDQRLHDQTNISFVENLAEIEQRNIHQEQYGAASQYAALQPTYSHHYDSQGQQDMDILDCIDDNRPEEDVVQPATDRSLDALPWCPLSNISFNNPPSYSPSPRRIFRPRKVF
ncbi:hypothetical protein CAPTEDRAFT_198825 [Capitella teleta]|uniref:Uncharacterized protein n=1 Tax=Capitella teleta TaxID=283909 RepID=R7T403_CAPTE|nr:hypothetical protein CAPTEDRAFT_198825 [Capitella teleta]|eukprot:ELT87451.1 hypothetical protein CAPTEDRAFT_198825 [Capitella teleta]